MHIDTSSPEEVYIPEKLKIGDTIRVLAPSRSLSVIGDNVNKALKRLMEYGMDITFGKHCKETDVFQSASVEARIEDLHEVFCNPTVKGIFTAIGGYGANHLLQHIDYDLIKRNPKVVCGFSDITILLNAFYKKTGLVGYYGPHFSTWAMEKEFDYNKEGL